MFGVVYGNPNYVPCVKEDRIRLMGVGITIGIEGVESAKVVYQRKRPVSIRNS